MRSIVSSVVLLVAFNFEDYAVGETKVLLIAGGNSTEVGIDAKSAKLHEPFGAEWEADGKTLWIVEMIHGNRLLQVDSSGRLQHMAGEFYRGEESTKKKSKSAPKPIETAPQANIATSPLTTRFNGPHNLAVARDGSVFVADTWNGVVHRLKVATNTIEPFSDWNVAPNLARSQGPYCIALNPSSTKLYIANLQRIYEIDLMSGKSRAVAGNGEKGVPADGSPAIDSPLVDPRAVCVDRSNNIYVLERGGNALRVVDRDGMVRTVINRSGKKGMSSLRSAGLDSLMNGPKHLCVDDRDRVIIADAENHVILRYDPSSQEVTRIAGTGEKGNGPVGSDPLACQLNRPHGVSIHPLTKHVTVTDTYNDRILELVP